MRILVFTTLIGISLLAIVLKLDDSPQMESERIWTKKPKYDSPGMYGQMELAKRTQAGKDAPTYEGNYYLNEYKKALSITASSRKVNDDLEFIERGPSNVPGRTRAILVDPDDDTNNTIFAGAVAGGVWKTTDGGSSWTYLSDDFPNLSISWLAMSEANTSVIYAGTGEHFGNLDAVFGAGLFKTTDKGESWTQVASPDDYPTFKNVSRIVVDPSDENIVIATTSGNSWQRNIGSSIFKSTDGGTSWTEVLNSTARMDDLDYDPSDFNVMYAAAQNVGVYKSTDAGDTWSLSSTGLRPGGRVEITVSPANTNRIWASAQGGVTGTGSDLYTSDDAGATWNIVLDASGTNVDFLGGQGWYDNIITAHPFNENIVYVGGVNNFKYELTGTTANDAVVLEVTENGSQAFMSFINFGGLYLGGGMDLGSVSFADLRAVEIKFGEGSQMAHRFTVGGAGPGVPAADYIYQNYVEVPFQAYDKVSGEQLMVSFRDQQEDGAWNLDEANTDGGDGTANDTREYFYIHNVVYSATADENIAQNGGHEYEEMYFFWPVRTAGASFDPANLPVSSLDIDKITISGLNSSLTVVSDAYGEFNGINQFGFSGTESLGVHPDQHNITVYNVDEENGTYRILIGNDGGIYSSVSSASPDGEGDFTWIGGSYNTTQFYGADKAPGAYRFIGGTQDNGTWYHAEGVEGSASSLMTEGIGGDGFESLWHSTDINKMIGGSQFNGVAWTSNGGASWVPAANLPSGSGNAPFVTRLSHNKSEPDVVFAVATDAVYKSTDFGANWAASVMTDDDRWLTNSLTDVEVSLADPEVVWSGGYLDSNFRIHVSTDQGETFSAVNNYDVMEMGYVSGLGTHPSDNQTAYALFSFQGSPKVLRTENMGQSWEDISGFDGTGDRGFPDVSINDIFVFPTDENRIWVGSEIGIIESLDNGASWALLDAFPPISIFGFKLQDNTITIATHGRGIWSVDIEGILIAPRLEDAYMSPDGNINLEITYAVEFDYTEVYIEGALIATLDANEIGTVEEAIANSGVEGEVTIEIIGYKDDVASTVVKTTRVLFTVNDVASSYATDLSDAAGDFIGNGFSITTFSGFDDEAIHSDHPHGNGTNFIYYLKTPITVASSDAKLYYSDVAIIEPGEDGSSFGDEDFYDYVVVEASVDGKNWVALADGYDSDYNVAWQTAYDNGQDGRKEYFVDHEVDLLNTLSAGDVVLVRFRLFADPNTFSWGWTIDDIYIQEAPDTEVPPLSANGVELGLEVYPTVLSNDQQLTISNLQSDKVLIYDLYGKVVRELEAEDVLAPISVSGLEAGIYLISDNVSSSKFIVR